MIKTLTKHGNSPALIIDKPVLDLLHIEADTKLQISTDGHAPIIQPLRQASHERKLDRAIKDANAKYGRALRQLAE